MELWSRRKFFLTSLAGSAIAGAGKLFGRTPSNGSGELSLASRAPAAQGKRPLIISSANGVHALDKGMDVLKKAVTRSMRWLRPSPSSRTIPVTIRWLRRAAE